MMADYFLPPTVNMSHHPCAYLLYGAVQLAGLGKLGTPPYGTPRPGTVQPKLA